MINIQSDVKKQNSSTDENKEITYWIMVVRAVIGMISIMIIVMNKLYNPKKLVSGAYA